MYIYKVDVEGYFSPSVYTMIDEKATNKDWEKFKTEHPDYTLRKESNGEWLDEPDPDDYEYEPGDISISYLFTSEKLDEYGNTEEFLRNAIYHKKHITKSIKWGVKNNTLFCKELEEIQEINGFGDVVRTRKRKVLVYKLELVFNDEYSGNYKYTIRPNKFTFYNTHRAFQQKDIVDKFTEFISKVFGCKYVPKDSDLLKYRLLWS